MQIDLTTLTLRITEDSAEQLVNSLQLTVICTIRLLREGECILCLACTFRDINTTDGILTWAKGAMTGLYGRINCYSVIPIYSQLYGL